MTPTNHEQWLYDLYAERRAQRLRKMQKPGICAACWYWTLVAAVSGIIIFALRTFR